MPESRAVLAAWSQEYWSAVMAHQPCGGGAMIRVTTPPAITG
ncbi:hypothetical protein HMPREF9946_03242 [Acetobacteraceae bacterium AT-5844]|nr:hypothetical protein HMPREF9946_03242 [Acetobacteraceae bacterium AT-5844]